MFIYGGGMFKARDFVFLNKLGRSLEGLGHEKYVPNDCSKKLLAGAAMKVSRVEPVFDGSWYSSLHFCDGAYSFSQDYFELAV